MWTVYSIRRIESKEAPTFVTIKGPIVLTKYHSSLASALIKFGHREFYWEQSGVFDTRREAREIREKMIHDWTLNPNRIVEAPWEVEELRGYRYKPRIIIPCTLKVIEEFMSASAKLCKINSKYNEEYRITRNIELSPGAPRKTEEQKQVSKIKRDMRKKNNKVLIKADNITKTYEKYDEQDNIKEEMTVDTGKGNASPKDYDDELKVFLDNGGRGPWDE